MPAAKTKNAKPKPAGVDGHDGSAPTRAAEAPSTRSGQTAGKAPQSAAAISPFPPIADYAFLSNCHTGALVAPDGSIDWLCVPRFDAASVFGMLLDRQAGSFRFAPFGINVPAGRTYEPGTNTLITAWSTPTGWVITRDALTMGPRRGEDHVTPHTRPPTDDDADHALVRVAVCLEGEVELELVCEPVFEYGRMPAEWRVSEEGHRAETTHDEVTLRLQTDMTVGIEGDWVKARHVLNGGERAYCALSWGEQLEVPQSVDEAITSLDATTRFWRTWLKGARLPDHRWRPAINRSALAIKGLTYMPTGATVAALTTSLPETPGGERNWDYRYTWLRDSTFTLRALHYLNLDWEANEFMQFVADLEPNEDGALQIMYGIDGRRDLTESLREDLSGYAGAHPVRVGNGAFDQRQNDVFGAALDSILLHTRRSKRLPRRLWPVVQAQARCATAVWREPDQGIWEARGAPATTSPPSSCAGSRWTAPRGSRKWPGTASSWTPGAPRRPRSGPTSKHTPSPTAASCANTTKPTRSTRRTCWRRSSASCPATTNACRRACARSPTTSPKTGSSCATAPRRPTTACRARRGAS